MSRSAPSSPAIAPAHVEAICIAPGEIHATDRFARATADFSGLTLSREAASPTPFLGESAHVDPFAMRDTSGTLLLPGVHLHWALPDALTRGELHYQVTRDAINELRLLGVPLPLLVQLLQAIKPEWVTAVQSLAADGALGPNGDMSADAFWPGLTLLQTDDYISNYTSLGPFGNQLADTQATFRQPADSQRFSAEDAFVDWLEKTAPGATAHRAHFLAACGTSHFPPVPDRWLVTRLVIPDSATLQTTPIDFWQSWVVESNFMHTDAQACIAPLEASQQVADRAALVTRVPAPEMRHAANLSADTQPFVCLGRAVPAEAWQENQAAENRYPHLTAVGYGEPTFASYYPNCRTVFGFYDSLADSADAGLDWASHTLAYVVVGWYSDAGDDPLAQEAADFLAEAQWRLPEAATANALICSGAVTGVRWGKAAYLHAAAADIDQVVVGNTAAEALAAYLSGDGDGTAPTVAHLLEALQLGLLPELASGAAGLTALENALHNSGFGAIDGGRLWMIEKKTEDDNALTPAARFEQITGIANGVPDPAFGQITLSETLAEQLDALNVLQQTYESLWEEAGDRRWQLFSDWYRSIQLRYPELSHPDAKKALDDRLAPLDLEVLPPDSAALQQQWQKLVQAHQALSQTLAREGNYQLRQVPAPRYWQPNDPVVLLTGPDAMPTVRYGSDGADEADGYLTVRLPEQFLAIGSWLEIAREVAAPLLHAAPPILANALPQIWAEALLVIYGNDPASGDSAAHQTLLAALRPDANEPAIAPGQPIAGYTGYVPARLTYNRWPDDSATNPWHPLLLQWDASFAPLGRSAGSSGELPPYAADFMKLAVLDHDHIDLQISSLPPDSTLLHASAEQQMKGSVILTPHAMRTLADQTRRFLAGDATLPDRLQALLDKSSQNKVALLSQSLTGFNDHLLMRRQVMQLAIHNPFVDVNTNPTALRVANHVGRQHDVAPHAEWYFNPIRAGLLSFYRLRLVDAFGQLRDIDLTVDKLRVSEKLRRPGPPAASGYNIVLPPRIAQPARLWFRWLCARDDSLESNTHPASSPVFGWVLVNHLEDSLMLYSGDGDALGSLRAAPGKPGPAWYPAPGTEIRADQIASLPTAADGLADHRGEHLQAFVNGILAYRSEQFDAFLAQINRVLTVIQPGDFRQHDALAVLMSRPLALTRARLRLDVKGLPAASQALSEVASADPPTDGFDAVSFNVRLGDLVNHADGLVGYYIETAGSEPAAATYAHANFHAEDKTASLHLSLQPDDVRVVTMLVDPRAPVHATSGILPVKSIELPPDQYQPALQRMAFTFLVNPLLSVGDLTTIALPRPRETDNPWHWIAHNLTADEGAGDTARWLRVEQPGTVDATAHLSQVPPAAREGWLQLQPFAADSENKDDGNA